MSDTRLDTRIKKLSPLLINQLAAGEVVTRPAAVVKELLENALDAGATNIEVCITQGGMGMIEIIDNGGGIHPDDMVMAVTRHATSKVADIANLQGISTLGFRGEALAATAAVSRLTLSSSHNDSGVGRQLQIAGVFGDTLKLTPVVHLRGTTVKVKDLYFNVPARRGNIKSMATEFMHIETIVREVAIARADVTLTLYHDQKKRLQLCDSVDDNSDHITRNYLSLSRLEQALGLSLNEDAIEVLVDLSNLVSSTSFNEATCSDAKISGWIWPNQNKISGLPKLLYVNGRLIKDASISHQLRQAASSIGCDSLHYALYFELPTEWLNINVHPAKQRIKISPLNNILAHLGHMVQTKLSRWSVSSASTLPTDLELDKLAQSSLLKQNTRQVQAPTRQYHTSIDTDDINVAMDHYPASSVARPCDNSTSDIKGPNDINLAVNNDELLKLPLCLDVIPDLLINDQSANNAEYVASSPWLLFFSQGQLLLVSQQDWYSKVNALFDSNWFVPFTVINNAKISTAKISTAETINQHLIQVASQMSAPDLLAFKSDAAHILKTCAIKAATTSQLLTMLLTTPMVSP